MDCTRRAAAHGEEDYGSKAKHFVEFYVDDGLLSVPTPAEVIDLLARTQEMLADSNLRLHKFASNSKEVMEAFPINKDSRISTWKMIPLLCNEVSD